MRRILLLALLAGLASGCSTMSSWTDSILGGEDNSEPPTPLTDIEASVQLDRRWSVDIGVGYDEQFINLQPAVAGERLYAADRRGRVVALAAVSGETLWSTATDAPLASGPGTGEGLVVVGSSDGEVIALDADSGTVRWRVEVSSEVLSVPRVDLDKVIVQTADGTIAALDGADGRQVWINDRTVPVLTLRGTSSPAVALGLVVAGFSNGKLVAFRADKGFPVWEKSVAIPQGRSELERIVDIDGNPVIAGNAVYVTTYQGRVARLELGTGNVAWEREMSSSVGLGVDFSQVYITDDRSNVWALSRNTGTSAWKLESLAWRDLTAPQPIGDHVAVADALGYVHLLSRYDGHIAGRVEVDSAGVRARPLAVDNMLYVFGNSGKLAAYTLKKN
ncbi:MAG: outer membrane protein assembly factor BamB [Gammaproteobacteria bacterium]|jgi:outer membrane protein assembly factor BamB